VWAQLTMAEQDRERAEEALRGPMAELERAEAERAECERRVYEIKAAKQDPDMTVRIVARGVLRDTKEELADLTAQAEQARKVLAPLQEALRKAQVAEDAARAEGALIVAASADPLGHPYGYAMPGHLVRMSTIWPEIVTAGDSEHPLWGEAWDLLRGAAIGAGVAKSLQEDAIRALLTLDERLRDYWPALTKAGDKARMLQNLPPPAQLDTRPAADVMAQTFADLGAAGIGHQSLPGLPGHGHDLRPTTAANPLNAS
jgi:hypothetical protein